MTKDKIREKLELVSMLITPLLPEDYKPRELADAITRCLEAQKILAELDYKDLRKKGFSYAAAVYNINIK